MAKGIMYIDGQRVPFDGEKNVLAVIRKAGINMPTFCYYSELSVHGACRMCRCIFRCRERKRPQRPEYCRKLLSLQRFPEGGAQPGLSPGAPIFFYY